MKFILLFFIGLIHSEVLAADKFRLAMIYPRTGKQTDFYCISNAFSESLNPTQYTIKHFDNENSDAKTLEQTQEIIKEGFDAVIGTRTSQEALVAAPLLEKAHIPFIVPLGSHVDITKNKKFVIGMVNTSEVYAQIYSQFIVNELKAKRILAIENTSLPYSQFYIKETLSHIRKKQPSTEIKIIKVFENYKDFSQLNQQIDSFKPELVYLPLYTQQVVQIFTALENYKHNLNLLAHASVNDSRDILKMTTNPHLNLLFDGIWNGKLIGPMAKEYQTFMKKCPGHQDSLRTVLAYDSLKILNMTIKENPNLRGLALVNTMKKNNFHGLLGSRLRKSGEPRIPLNLYKLNSQKVEFFKTYYAE